MPDIADQLDAAIGAAPPDAPAIDATLVLGRRALLRRRLAYGVGTVATALVIGGTAWAVSPGDGGPSRSEDPGWGGAPSESASVDPPQAPVDGVDPGSDIGQPDDKRTNGDQRDDAWPGVPRDDLVHFALPQTSLERGLTPARDGVVIVEQRYDVDLGASFAPPRDTGIAEVLADGETWYVVARRPDDYIAVPAAEARSEYGVEDLDEFIAFAQERYAEGGGGLL